MAVFTDILPPPQSLENLDNWGDLDSLSWSLDSTIWDSAGIYGLVVSEPADSTSSFSYHLTRCLALSGDTQTSGAMSGVVVAEIAGDGYSKTDGKLSVGRVQHVSCLASAGSSASIVFERIRHGEALAGISASGGLAGYVLVRTLSGSSPSLSDATLSFFRIRTEKPVSASASSQVERGIRIRQSVVSGASYTAENPILPSVVRTISALALARASASDIFLRISPLMVSEPAVSGDSSVVNRVRTSGVHNAFSSSSVQSSFIRARSVNATSSSASKEFFTFLRVRDISFSAFANTFEEMEGSRFYGLVAVESAKTGELIQYFRIVQGRVLSELFSDGYFIGGRLIGVTCKADAQTIERVFLSRVIELLGFAVSYSGSKISPAYKGWNWEGRENPEKQEWEQSFSDKVIWSKENSSADSVWVEQEREKQNWKQQAVGKNCWNGVVEWQ